MLWRLKCCGLLLVWGEGVEVEEAYWETGGVEEKILRGDIFGAGPWVDYSDYVWNETMGMNSVSSFYDWGC
jgi:hypothetical protein